MDKIENSIIAIVRDIHPQAGCEVAQGLLDAGIRWIEVSLSCGDAALQALRNISLAMGDRVRLGAGTVTTPRQAEEALAAGAQYLITPGWDKSLAEYILARSVPLLPGVYSPGEIMQAQALGIDTVKLFPAGAGGLDFIHAMQGPFPHMNYVAVGGVSCQNAAELLHGGFYALGVGGELVPRGSKPGCGAQIGQHAAAFVAAVQSARR